MPTTERRRTSARRESLLGDQPGAFASARFVRITPLKARRVVDLVRGLPVDDALSLLQFAPQAASETVYKVLESAVANAETTEGLEARRPGRLGRDGRRGSDHEALAPPGPGPRDPHQQAHQPHHPGRPPVASRPSRPGEEVAGRQEERNGSA